MKQCILLTGASGFIGYYLAQALLKQGHAVRALVRPSSPTAQLKKLGGQLHLVTGDLLDTDSLLVALEGCHTVVHAAAKVSFDANQAAQLYQTNTQGTANLINCCIECGTPRFIHISSVAALDRSKEKSLISERNRWQEKPATTHYAASKFGGEREVWRGQAEGLSVAALYPATVIGPGNWWGDSSPHLFRTAEGRKFYSLGTSGFVDVRDVADALLLLVERNIDGDRFLLCAENLSWESVLTKIAKAVKQAPPRIGLAKWQTTLLWPLAVAFAKIAGKNPRLSRDFHRSAQAKHRYDGSKITQETNFHYRAVSVAIEETAKLYLAQAPAPAWWS